MGSDVYVLGSDVYVLGLAVYVLGLGPDLYILGVLLVSIVSVCILYPDTLHHPDNHCYVDRFTTPQHIVPEWYFLPFYSMLRSCSNKGVGVVLLGVSVLLYGVLLGVGTEYCYSRASASYSGVLAATPILSSWPYG